jgi:uncharacterized membrane protein (DUF485 family)
MSTSEGPRTADDAINWEEIERSPEFRELIARKRRFVLPATIFFLSWYTAFILLAGYAEDFMGSSIYEGFTVGYLLALSQFVMVWVLTWMYLRKARNEFDPLEEAAVEHLRERADAESAERTRTGRFERSPASAEAPASSQEEARR